MTMEPTLLAWAVVLGLVHAVASGQFTIVQHGMRYRLSSRDVQKPTGIGRASPACVRKLHADASLLRGRSPDGHVAGRRNWPTMIGAQVYLWARVAYVPLYAFDITVVRTIAFASAMGIVMILVALT